MDLGAQRRTEVSCDWKAMDTAEATQSGLGRHKGVPAVRGNVAVRPKLGGSYVFGYIAAPDLHLPSTSGVSGQGYAPICKEQIARGHFG